MSLLSLYRTGHAPVEALAACEAALRDARAGLSHQRAMKLEAQADRDRLAAAVRDLHNEVDCRIEHGAESGGHLEYVRGKLGEALP